MEKVFAKYWFFLGIAVIFVVAFTCPQAATVVKKWPVLDVGIFLCFLITGLTLRTSEITGEIRNFKGVLAALISTFVLFPAVAITLARVCCPDNIGFVVGVSILAVAPVTIASGAVMTGIAKGNIALSLMICVVANFLAIFTVPISLSLVLNLDKEIDLQVADMIFKLVRIVFIPTVIGQVLRIWLKAHLQRWTKTFSIFSQCIVLLIILNAAARSRLEMSALGFRVIYILLFTVALHALILLLNFTIAKAIRLNQPSVAAFTIHVSQKTLTISSVVWVGYFAADYPFALIPVVAYHLTQMIADTFVAHRFRAHAEATK